MFRRVFVLLLSCCFCGTLAAEQVTLKNGDRVTGTIVNMTDKKLTIKTDYAGVITIDWDAVAQFSSSQPMVVTKTDKQVVSGAVNAQESEVTVSTSAGAQAIPKADVAVMRSTADQAAYEKSLHPGFFEAWTGGGSFGLGLARGNSDTTNIALGFAADRKTTSDEWNIVAASLYSTSTVANVTTPSASNFFGGIRYSRNFTKRLFGFGLFGGGYDHLQLLDERLSPAGGLGFHAIASKNTTLDILGGIGYTYENYSTGLVNNFVNITVGEEFAHNFNAKTAITENLYIFPYLNDLGNYRGTFNFGVASKFYKSLTWNVNFGDIYNSVPVVGLKNNDLVLTTGVGVTFGGAPK